MHNLNDYNEEQLSAVYHNKGPAIILAGPGSGKTTVIVGRVKHLITKYKVNPSSILVITYTKAAALSMQSRFFREMEGKVFPVSFGTFHAIFYQIIKEQSFFHTHQLINNEEKRYLIKSLIEKSKISDEMAEQILVCISLFKNGFCINELPVPTCIDSEHFQRLYEQYNKSVYLAGKLDFDDMVLRCKQLLEQNPDILNKWQKRFSYVLVDEFQDSNKLQYEVIKLLSLPENNLFVVGDDDQSIYGFRGASPNIMQQFEKEYPKAKRIVLNKNYRSRKDIIQAANIVIGYNCNRINKRMITGTMMDRFSYLKAVNINGFDNYLSENGYIVNRIKELYTCFPYEEMAIIFRTNQEMENFASHLEKEKITFQLLTSGKDSRNHFILQDIISYLHLICNHWERKNVLNVLNKPNRKISRVYFQTEEYVDLTKIGKHLADMGNLSLAYTLNQFHNHILNAKNISPYLAIYKIRKALGYENWLSEKAGDNRTLYADYRKVLDEITLKAKEFESTKDYLDYLLTQNNKKFYQNKNLKGVNLLTLHGSKGLEFSYVCIPNVNEGNIPHGKLITEDNEEEERRLFYVGMTRAKVVLDVLYLKGSKEHQRFASRFLTSILDI